MKKNGFSLIELLMVVAIIAILGTVVIPSYTSYVVRSKRVECRAAIMQTMQQQERYYTQKNAYLSYPSTTTTVGMKTFSGDTENASACSISSEACAATSPATGTLDLASCVLVRGTPKYTDAEVGQITFKSDGTRGCTGTNSAKCWQ